ncbi:MAG: hypothetical protein RLZZ241_153 [Bacteroidota bacterium]
MPEALRIPTIKKGLITYCNPPISKGKSQLGAKRLLLSLFSLLHLVFVQGQQSQVLFASGDLGYSCYRIPALISWSNTQILAFAEGRKDNCSDFGNVDILMRKSEDGGKSWSPIQVVVDFGELQAGNPTPIFDQLDPDYPKGRLFLFYNTGTASEQETREGLGRRRAHFITTIDGGLTWSAPQEFTEQAHFDRFSTKPTTDARSLAFAPGHGMQLKSGRAAGRLVIPANHSLGPPLEEFAEYRSYAIYSDDHGKSWNTTPDVNVPASNEAMATQLNGDTLLMVIRMQDRKYQNKLIARSTNSGSTWESTWLAQDLTTPMCQSSIISVSDSAYNGIYHLGPAATDSRKQLTLWHSDNGGINWEILHEIWPGSAAYSDLAYLNTGKIALLYERNNYTEITFQLLDLSKL